MNFKVEKAKCGKDGVYDESGLDNWPDGQGGLITVDKCRLSGVICDAYHCPKKHAHISSHFDALEAVGLTESYKEEMNEEA
jgi:hypothetical protein